MLSLSISSDTAAIANIGEVGTAAVIHINAQHDPAHHEPRVTPNLATARSAESPKAARSGVAWQQLRHHCFAGAHCHVIATPNTNAAAFTGETCASSTELKARSAIPAATQTAV